MNALILAPFHPAALARLEKRLKVACESWTETKRLLAPEEIIERTLRDDLEILVVEADFVFEEVFALDRLRMVGVCRSDVNHIDIAAATEHGCLVINTPGRNAVSVAELTVGLIISLARRIPAADALVRSGKWDDPVGPYISMRGVELAGKTVGIIGYGAIGREVARRLAAFDMRILVHDPYVESLDFFANKVDLPGLVAGSDFISIHCAVTPETTGLVGPELIRLMKPGAYLVNTAGWEIVHEKSLLEALAERRIAGAAFDIFETHPVPPRSPFLRLDNVVLTPHLGGATGGTIARYSAMIADDIESFLDGRRPRNLVNPEAWRGG